MLFVFHSFFEIPDVKAGYFFCTIVVINEDAFCFFNDISVIGILNFDIKDIIHLIIFVMQSIFLV